MPLTTTHFRRIIRITAEDSPNVKRYLRYKAAGLPWPGEEPIIPGVLSAEQYMQRRRTWDQVRQCIGLDAQFYTGGELLLFPPLWRTRAGAITLVQKCQSYPTEAIGIDPAEGGDSTSWAAGNRWGIKEVLSMKTPNTSIIVQETLAFARKHNMLGRAENWVFDRGGGGKQRADDLRAMGYGCRSIGFGEHPHLEIKRGMHQVEQRKDIEEDRYEYVNLRAQMYHELSAVLDPSSWVNGFPTVMQTIKDLEGIGRTKTAIFAVPGETEEEFQRRRNRLLCTDDSVPSFGFALPPESWGEQYEKLHRQLSVMPKITDEEGRYKMPPKQKRDKDDKRQTLQDMIGHSPDEADACVLMLFAMIHKQRRAKAGAA